jgi:uncharacterized lipoprotein YajG
VKFNNTIIKQLKTKSMKINILIAAAFALSISLLTACSESSTTKETTSDTAMNMDEAGMNNMNGSGSEEHDQMMKKMMDDMTQVKMSGDFDIDFAP